MSIGLNYVEQGDGPPLTLLHGLFGSSTNWRSVARALAVDYRVICVDLRNHGRSPHVGSMSYPEMAEDVIRLLDRLELAATAMLGHSMGGKTAMQLALEHPQRVERLVVVDIAPVVSTHDPSDVLQAMMAVPLATARTRQDADHALAQTLNDPGLRQFLIQNLVSQGDGYAWRINLDAIKAHLAQLLDFRTEAGRLYRGPTQFIRGALSDYLNPEDEPTIRQLFPNARIDTIEGAGHWLHAEKPREFLEVCLEFLSERTSP